MSQRRGLPLIILTLIFSCGPFVVVAFPLPALAHGGDTSMIHICMTRRGVPRFVGPSDRCRPTETAAHWPRELPTPAPPSVAVSDSLGARVGDILGFTSPEGLYTSIRDVPIVTLEVEGRRFIVRVTHDRIYGNRGLKYRSGDCAGQAYIEVDDLLDKPQLQFEPAIAIVGWEVYVPGEGALETISGLYSGGVPGSCGSAFLYGELKVRPAQLLLDMNGRFQPPFRIR